MHQSSILSILWVTAQKGSIMERDTVHGAVLALLFIANQGNTPIRLG
jgi:hypothetical protein